jgi:hypothetical protein
VYDDRVTITFNYSGDNRTITLPEVDAAAEAAGFDGNALCSTIVRRYELFFVVRNVFALTISKEDC